MTMTRYTGQGPMTPDWRDIINANNTVLANIGTIDAAGEQIIMYGRVWIDGAPAGTKTLSSSGGKLHFNVGTVTWASAGTTLRYGVQDLSTSAGPPARGDGSYDVYGELVQGTDTLTSTTWRAVNMSSGTKDIAHGDFIALVLELTVRNGADSVIARGLSVSNSNGNTATTTFLSSVYAAGSLTPIALIEFDDGTLATFSGSQPVLSVPTEAWTDATNPDERGIIFQVQQNIKIGEIIWWGGIQAATADYDLKVYSDPLGTPTLMYSASMLAEQTNAIFVDRRTNVVIASGSEPELLANTDYVISLKATGAGNIELQNLTYNAAAYRFLLNNGLMYKKATRNNSTGAFSVTDTIVPLIAVRASHYDSRAFYKPVLRQA